MVKVESGLSGISQHCNSRILDKIERNYKSFDENTRVQDKDHHTFAARLSLLQTIPLTISRLLRTGSSSLLCAKLLVLARLLHSALSSSSPSSGPPPLIDILRSQLAALRRSLLLQVDRIISRADTPPKALVEVMCAFALATSSSSADVLQHFLHTRVKAVSAQLGRPKHDHSNILKALRLYVQTLQVAQTVFPVRMADALLKLKAVPLLRDADVRAQAELRVDVRGAWVGDDIKGFTPWVRHDDLLRGEVEKMVKDWARKAFVTLVEGLRILLARVDGVKELMGLRKDILDVWLRTDYKVSTFLTEEPLEKFREVLNERFVKLIQARAGRLRMVGEQIEGTIADWRQGIHEVQHRLWDASTTSMDLTNGAVTFKQAILDRSNGRSEPVQRVMGSYNAWLGFVDEITAAIKTLRDQKWDEDIEDEQDDFGIDSRQGVLSEDDPAFLEKELNTALDYAFEQLQGVIGSLAASLEGEHLGAQSIFILRICREMRRRMPLKDAASSLKFSLATVEILQTIIAQTTVQRPVQLYEKHLMRRNWGTKVSARALWDGTYSLSLVKIREYADSNR
jgi:conserved oligomeric Golgi complex subunit 1